MTDGPIIVPLLREHSTLYPIWDENGLLYEGCVFCGATLDEIGMGIGCWRDQRSTSHRVRGIGYLARGLAEWAEQAGPL